MKYAQPIGGAVNAPYVDANPVGGIEGSAVPAAAIEGPQREIVAVITGAGLVPDDGDLTQLRQAIQRMIEGSDFKDSCRAATTANVAALSGLLTIDGIVLDAGNRVLVKDQAVASQNGIYMAAAGAWARAADADEGAELAGSILVAVESGTANADSLWISTSDGTITVGVTNLAFTDVQRTLGSAGTYDQVTVDGKGRVISGVAKTYPAFSVHRNEVNQTSIASGVTTKVLFTTERYDTANAFDNGAASRFTPLVAGKYLVTFFARLNTASDQSTLVAAIYKNGGSIHTGVVVQSGAAATATASVSALIDMNGSTDYLEFFITQDTGSARDLLGIASQVFATGIRIG